VTERNNDRIQGLDLIRGGAILLVMVHHAWPEVVGSGGIVGVVAFFALSGYLITGVLAKDIQRNGRVRYGHFYRNRALRLLPALLLLVVIFAVYTAIVNPFGDRGDILRSILVAITYTANIPFDHGSPALGHLWTLATEEQFYLVWPVLLSVGLRWSRLRLVILAAAGGILLICVASIILTAPAIERIYTLPSSWAFAMVVGAVAKLGESHVNRLFASSRMSRRLVGIIAGTVLVALSFLPESKAQPITYLLGGPLIAVLTVAVIFHLRTWTNVPLVALKPLLALGTVSYAAYLWNWPITIWLGGYLDGQSRSISSILLTIVAATLSWWAVERPAALWKKQLDARDRAREGSTVGIESRGN